MATAIVHREKQSTVRVEVTLPWDEWKEYIPRAIAAIGETLKIPGFRPGRIPPHEIERRTPRSEIVARAADAAIRATYPSVVTEHNIDTIGTPDITLTKIAEGNPLEYTAQTAVMPTIDLGAWEKDVGAVNASFIVAPVEPSDQEVEDELARLARMRSTYTAVDRPAAKDDRVTIDFSLAVDGVPVENGSSTNHELLLGSGVFIPGFEEHVEGMSTGDTKDFDVTFPSDYHAKHLAGKTASAHVTVKTVSERHVPVIDDAFAVSLGNFKDRAALVAQLRDGMAEERRAQQRSNHDRALVTFLAGRVNADIPEVLIEGEIKRLRALFTDELSTRKIDPEHYLKTVGKTWEDLEKEWRGAALERIKTALALRAIAADRGIDVSAEKIEEQMNHYLSRFKSEKDARDQVNLEDLYAHVKGQLIEQEVLRIVRETK